MTRRQPALRTLVADSLRRGGYADAVLWGAVVAGVVSVFEYNLPPAADGQTTLVYSLFAGGVVAGVLYSGGRAAARRAGASASAVAAAVLGPIALVLLTVADAGRLEMQWLLARSGFALVIAYPMVVGLYAACGWIAAHVAHWLTGRSEEPDPRAEQSVPE